MKQLTKGNLVMTEWGLAWYNGKAQMSGSRYFVLWLAGQSDAIDGTPIKATRADVEAYLKGKGFVSNGKGSYMYSSKTNKYFIHSFNNTDWDVDLDNALTKYDFDTAPAMQAEAILMARLLNATKDNLNL